MASRCKKVEQGASIIASNCGVIRPQFADRLPKVWVTLQQFINFFNRFYTDGNLRPYHAAVTTSTLGCLYSRSRGNTSLANKVMLSTVSSCEREPA
jgi:hypothetical protein